MWPGEAGGGGGGWGDGGGSGAELGVGCCHLFEGEGVVEGRDCYVAAVEDFEGRGVGVE